MCRGLQPIRHPHLRLGLGGPVDVENQDFFVVLGQFVQLVQLDGRLGASLLTEAAEDAAGQVDDELGRVLLVVRPLGRHDPLDGIAGADHHAQGAGHAAAAAVVIHHQLRVAPKARTRVPLFLRILEGDRLAEAILEGGGQAF